MKLWEAMKLLEEDPTLKFEYKNYGKKWLLYTNVGGLTGLVFYMLDCWDSQGELMTETAFGSLHGNLATSDNWQLVRQPVTWQEAIQSRAEGKKVYVEVNCQLWTLVALIELPEYLAIAIKNGKWYVED